MYRWLLILTGAILLEVFSWYMTGLAAEDAQAVFAGGCFWCMTPPFEKLDGVRSVVSGYAGGIGPDPTYETYSRMGYVEAVRITYDPARITYKQLLDVFWRQINPTDADGQFCDRGHAYISVIYFPGEAQKRAAEKSRTALAESGRFDKPIVTEIAPFTNFYPAEEYHQDYYKKHPLKYKFYRYNCGRDQYLERVWGQSPDPADPPDGREYRHYTKEELRERLTPLQYRVTQEGQTEPAFRNAYWDNHEPGIYVDIVSGEPLFSSQDKFDSGTGWPSFTRPLVPANVVEKKSRGLFSHGIEVRSRHADSHLGDLFHDGPPPTGLRYCIDSAALRFIPEKDLVKEGYGEFLELFHSNNPATDKAEE